MRHPIVALLLIIACSSADGPAVTSPPPVTPTPPVGVTPTVVTVLAGDGQQAEPGATLTTKPVVAVKDAAGLAVAGVTVSFAVDSGGGSLQSTSVTTGTDGTASPGDWRLGVSEGRNVVSATVGSLTRAKLVATALVVPVTIADQTVATNGGNVIVVRPGSPLNGMAIAVPAAAFPVPQTFGISYTSSAAAPRPTGSTVISPLITIRTSDGRVAAKPLFITIPVTVPAGMVPVMLMRDPATGRHEVLPTVDYGATFVTGMTGHLNGAKLLRRIPPAVRAAMRTAQREVSGSANVVVVAMPPEVLDPDHDSGFRPGVDSWEFPEDATILDNGMSSGIAATAAWYFVEQKTSNGSLWKKYQEAEGVAGSNRRGIRWASLTANASYNAIMDELKSLVPTLVAAGRGTARTLAQRLSLGSFNAVRTALYDSPGEPQLVVLFPDDTRLTEVMVLVYRSTGQKLFAVDPSHPGQTIVLDFSSGNLAPVTLDLSTVPFTNIAAPGTSLLANIDDMDDDWSAVQAGTIGDGEYPSYRAMVGWGNPAGESTELIGPVYTFSDTDTPTIWIDCVTCIGTTRPSPFAVGTAKIASLDLWARSGTVWVERGTSPVVLPALASPGTATLGVEVLTFRAGDATGYWTDWLPITVKRLQASIAPTAPTGPANTEIGLTLSIVGAPSNLEYAWDFSDGPTIVTSTLATAHKWANEGTYSTKVTARDKTTKQPIAKASVTVVVTTSFPVWRITSATTDIGVNPLNAGERVAWGNLSNGFTGDSAFWTQIKNGTRDGALVFATKDINQFDKRGVYLMPTTPIDFGAIPAIPFPMVTIVNSASNGSVGGRQPAPFYTESGSPPGNAVVTGLSWSLTAGTTNQPSVYGRVTIAINGTTATGQIEKTYVQIGGNDDRIVRSWTSKFTFVATRVR